jgi:hypothetical protein
MSISFAKRQAIKLRGIEREERRQRKIYDRETKLARAAGMTWAQWKRRQRHLEKVAVVKDAIETAKRDPELRAALLRALGCSYVTTKKALPAPPE